MPHKVYAALKNDVNEGWVWLTESEAPSRSIIKITNDANKESIYCEALKIDHNYINDYKNGWTYEISEAEAVITINSWYRSKLGISRTNDYHNLTIKPANHLFGRFMASIGHPQIVVRLATWLGVISVVLGVIGLFK